MYRVVLIDDEAVILEGLKRVVKWENYDCQVVGTAFDAKSGNDLIRQEKPDILFTDIRMPGQSGLTMLKRAFRPTSGGAARGGGKASGRRQLPGGFRCELYA